MNQPLRRIGLILPADNVVMEPELYGLGLPGVVYNTIRLMSTDHDAMRKQAQECGEVINELGVDAVVYACAETSFNAGGSTRRTMSERIARDTGLPVVTATDALNDALRALGIGKIALLTPYTARSGVLLEETLAGAGFTTTSARHHDFRAESADAREWYVTNRVPPQRIAETACELDLVGADSLVIASTNFAALGVISGLEASLGVPVLTTNQAIIAWCARELGLELPPHLGKLADVTNGRSDAKGVFAR